MGELYDLGASIGALASELIEGTPSGYVTIGSSYADIAPRFGLFDQLPNGDAGSGAISGVNGAMTHLSHSGQGAADIDSQAFGPNPVFANMERVATDIDEWKGDDATNFIENYKAQLPVVSQQQFVAASVLTAALEAQAQLFVKAQENLRDIGNKTLGALEAADGRGNAVFSFAMTVFVAVGTVAITALSAGAGAVAISVAVGAASTAGSARSIDHDVESPEEVMAAMYAALTELDDQIVAREEEIKKGLDDMAGVIQDELAMTSWGEGNFPVYRFKPTGFADGSGDLGEFQG